MTTTSTTNQASSSNQAQQGTSSSTATTDQTGTNTSASNMSQNTVNSSKTGPAAAAMAILNKYGTNGLSQEDINKYMDPNLRDRLTALQAQQQQNNSVQQNALRGNSISQGALGGDRAKVAQAELMRGQGLNDASALQAEREKAYTQALGMAQADRQAALQAAGMMGTETSGTAATTGTSNTTGTSSMQGTQTSQGQFQSTGHSDTNGSSNTTSGPGSGWGTAAAVLGMLKDGGRVQARDMGGRVFRDMGGSITYAAPMAIPAMQPVQGMTFPSGPVSYSLPKLGNHARKKINGMMDKLDQPGGKENKGGGSGGGMGKMPGGGGGMSGGSGMSGMGGAEGATEGAANGVEGAAGAAGEGGAAAGEGAAAAGEGAAAGAEGVAAAGEGATAAGEGVTAAGEGLANVGEGLVALFSDERVKENKRVIGKTFDGQHIYAFNYKGHPATQIGLMAQEVERHHPEAVGQQQGIKTVQYDKATRDSARRGHFADGGYTEADIGSLPLMWRSRADEELEPYAAPANTGASGGLGALANLTAERDAVQHPRIPAMIRPAPAPAEQPGMMARIFPHVFGGVEPSVESVVSPATEAVQHYMAQPQPEASTPVPQTPSGTLATGLTGMRNVSETGDIPAPTFTSAPVPQDVQQTPVKTFRVEPPASVLAPALGGKAEPGAEQIAPPGAVGEPATGISDAGMNFIKEKEGFTSRPKWDYKQNSIGYGTKALPGETTIDTDTADERARQKATTVSEFISKNSKVPLSQNQHDALVSFGYNLGTGEGGLSDIMPLINKGDFEGAAQKIQRYNHTGGKVKAGLTERRSQEAQLLLGNNVKLKPSLEPVEGEGGGISKGLSSAPEGKISKDEAGVGAIGDKLKQILGGNKTTDAEKGGILKRLLGIDFNPLKLSDNERMALIAGGLGGAKTGVDAYTTMRGQDMNQAQSAAQLAESQRQHIASTGLQQQSIDQAKTSFGVIGVNPDGTPKYGFIDAAGQTLKPASEVAGGPGAPAGASNLRGDEYLATVDPVVAEQARRVALGQEKMPLPSKFNPTALMVQRAVRQAYPDYNAGAYDFMQKWNDPNRGSSNNLKAANTYYQHTGELYDLTENLPSSSTPGIANKAGLWWKRQTNDPNLAAYEDVAKQVAEEKLKAIKGGTPTKMEIEEAMKDYDPSRGKETIRRVLMQDSRLIEGRVKNLEADYNNHTPKNAPRLTALNEDSLAIRDKIMGKTNREGATNTPTRPAGVSNTQLIRQAQEAVEIAVSKGVDRAKATEEAQRQLKSMGAL